MGLVFKKLSAFIFRKLLLSNTALTSTTKELVLKELTSSSRARKRKMRSSSAPLALKKLTASNLSLTKTESKFTFKELIANAFVAIFGEYGFRELSKKSEPIAPPSELGGITQEFNLGWLIVPEGEYTITATALSTGLKESKHSNSVQYNRGES